MAGVNKICHCGKSFMKPKNYSNKQWIERKFCSHKCASKKNIPEFTISFLYVVRRLSSTEIGKKYNVSGTHILRILKQNGIQIRSSKENKKISSNRSKTILKFKNAAVGRKLSEQSKDKLRKRAGKLNHNWRSGMTISKQGYLCFTQSAANGVHAKTPIHRMIAEWKYGRSILSHEHVHHIDGNKLNNNPDNLLLLSNSDHAILHTKDRENGKKLKSMGR